MLDAAQGNDAIARAIDSGRPFLAGRLGFQELDAVVTGLGVERQRGRDWRALRSRLDAEPSEWHPELLRNLDQLCGFFPAEPEAAQHLAAILLESFAEADILAVWHRRHEAGLMRRYCPAALAIEPRGLEPYYHPRPWSARLNGKRLLVVHPFEDSIRAQFNCRHRIFPGRDVLPDCQLQTLRAVQTVAGSREGHRDWFEALAGMQSRIDELEFDLAVIGAGAYGLPLAAHVKRSGRSAVHMAGATQLLFGIMGKRWEDRPEVTSLYNEHWVRPLDSERPPGFQVVEGGCYW